MKVKYVNIISPVIVILFLLILTPLAESTPIASRAALPAGLLTLDFEDLIPGVDAIVVNSQYSAEGVTFKGAEINMFAGQQLFASDLGRPASIAGKFNIAANTIGFDFVSSSPLTLVAYDINDVLIESVSASTTSGFLGLSTGNVNIYSWKVHDSGHQFAIDNLSFGATNHTPVPEAGTLMLLGSGLLGLGVFRKKLKR